MLAKRNMSMYYDGQKFEQPDSLYAYKKAKGTHGQPFEGVRIDTAGEVADYIKLVSAPPAERRAAKAPKAESAPQLDARPAGRFVKDEAAEVTYQQGRFIGTAIGGMAAYCTPLEGESHAQALTRGGLNRGRASRVIAALMDEGLGALPGTRKPNSPEALRAQQILTEVGQFVCRRK
jgi:hypothetical protein